MTSIEAPKGKFVQVGVHSMYVLDVGAGEPIIFLHGGGPGADGWVDFGMVLPYFTDRRCILPDLLQYGRSDLVHHNEPTWSFQARHIDLLMQALGVESADFICSSVGGTVALATAIEYPSRVRRIVLSGSHPTSDAPTRAPGEVNPGGAWIEKYYGGEGPTWQKARDLMAEVEYWDPDLVPDATVTSRYENTMRPEWLALVANANGRGQPQDLKDHLVEVKAPVLILEGKFDVIATPAFALYLSDLIPGSEVFIMDKTRHHPEEERPADYSRIVRAWLEFIDTPTGPFSGAETV